MCLRITQFGRYSNPREIGVNRRTPDFLALCPGILLEAGPLRGKGFSARTSQLGRQLHLRSVISGIFDPKNAAKGVHGSPNCSPGGPSAGGHTRPLQAARYRRSAHASGAQKSEGDIGPRQILITASSASPNSLGRWVRASGFSPDRARGSEFIGIRRPSATMAFRILSYRAIASAGAAAWEAGG